MGKCVSTGKKAHFMSVSKKKFKPEKPTIEKRGKKNKRGKQDPMPQLAGDFDESPVKSIQTEQKQLAKMPHQRLKSFQTQDPQMLTPQALQFTHINTQIEEDPEDAYEKAVRDYLRKPSLPTSSITQLIDACISGNVELIKYHLQMYQVNISQIGGRQEQVKVGNKTIPSENLNLLHLAVYHNQLNVVKQICESIPNLDLVFSGKIPSSSGLANESEMSIIDNSANRNNEQGSQFNSKTPNGETYTFGQIDKFNIASQRDRSLSQQVTHTHVRSLILFWALDKGNYQMLNYLWNFSKFKQTNWGIKNLEFMLLLANDLNEDEVFEILLKPKPFSECLKNLSFVEAMDFIEDHVINNRFVKEDMKLQLLGAHEMAPYSYVGALFHFASQLEDQIENQELNGSKSNQSQISSMEKQEDECEEDIQFEELLELYHKLNENYLKQIIHSVEVMERLEDIESKSDNFKKINQEHVTKIISMIKFINHFKRQQQNAIIV